MKRRFFLSMVAAGMLMNHGGAAEFPANTRRILFLGDSITNAGFYVDDFEAFVRAKFATQHIQIINCGLPSETVSGLSEAGHAGGSFPRPDLHERLDRVLALVKPDLVFACYGMNCGIYLPLDETRFAKYREGIEKLRAKVKAAGADIVHLTPPVFDPVPIAGRVKAEPKDGEMFSDYNSVLDRYSAWLVERGTKDGWRVIDIHTQLAAALAAERTSAPTFSYAKDGVHINQAANRVIATAIVKGLGFAFDFSTVPAEATKLIRERGKILQAAYLQGAGHKRPGIAKGLPVPEAEEKAAEIDSRIRAAVAK